MKKLVLVAALLAAAGPAAAAPTAFNGNLYEYIAGSFTWQQALANAAAAAPVAGYTAHLVTVTSAAEDNFVSNILTNNTIWMAGTDQATEGVWVWAAGPETGQIFFGPGAPVGAYSNWNAGEPNDFGGEDYLHTNINQGNWNDVTNGFTSGYVVEYSRNAVPEPAAWALMIAGFGLAGTALRRRPTAALA
jgi:hypothetical protein